MNSFLPNEEIKIPLSDARGMAEELKNEALSAILTEIENMDSFDAHIQHEGGITLETVKVVTKSDVKSLIQKHIENE